MIRSLEQNDRIFDISNSFEEGIKIYLFKSYVLNEKGSVIGIKVLDTHEEGTTDEEIILYGNQWYTDLDTAKKIALASIQQEAGRLFRLSKYIEEMI